MDSPQLGSCGLGPYKLHRCPNSRRIASCDIDFLVDLDRGRGLLDLGGLLSDLQDLLGAGIDLVERGSLHPYIRDRVLAEAVVL
ncbi:MAG: nucleotidyltransferase domain-containing protein [Bryobacteraceae bacterium]